MFLPFAFAFTAGFGFFLSSFWAPAPSRPGIDENAYLLGGRNFAAHGTTGFKPSDDFQYVGPMWVRTARETILPPGLPGFLRHVLAAHTKEGWYYPKYPAGVPLLNAMVIRVLGIRWVFAISPICASLAVLGMFFLGREIAGSFGGMLAMIALAANANVLEMAEDPNSHAPVLCFVIWGMFLLIRWWRGGRWWTGALAGFLLGYAVTIRYTEALLLFPLYPLDQIFLSAKFIAANHPIMSKAIGVARFLPIGPIGLAVMLRVRWRNARSWVWAALPILFWAVPVATTVGFNWFSMGHLTGYDTTRESTGFSVDEFLGKWDFALHELYLFGLFLLFPMGVAGLVLLFRRSWRLALFLVLWVAPGAMLYTAYYWGLQVPGVGFLRFFLTLFPPLIVAAMWFMQSATMGARPGRKGSIAGPLAMGLLTAATCAVGLAAGLPELERQHRGNMNLYSSQEHVASHLKLQRGRPMILAGEGMFPQLLPYLQFMIDADWYAYDAFGLRAAGGMGLFGALQLSQAEDHVPMLLQPERLEYMARVMKGKTAQDLMANEKRLMDAAQEAGRPIYAVLTSVEETDFRRRFLPRDYQMVLMDHWREPCNVRFPGDAGKGGGQPILRAKSPLVAEVQSGQPFIDWEPQSLKMFEIVRISPVEKPVAK